MFEARLLPVTKHVSLSIGLPVPGGRPRRLGCSVIVSMERGPGRLVPGDDLATLLLTVQAEDILSAGIGERAVVGDT